MEKFYFVVVSNFKTGKVSWIGPFAHNKAAKDCANNVKKKIYCVTVLRLFGQLVL